MVTPKTNSTDDKAVPAAEAAPPAESAPATRNIQQTPPLILDLGKKKRKAAKKIKKGKGKVHEHVAQAVQYTVETMGEEADNMLIVPVVLIYEKKRRKDTYYGNEGY